MVPRSLNASQVGLFPLRNGLSMVCKWELLTKDDPPSSAYIFFLKANSSPLKIGRALRGEEGSTPASGLSVVFLQEFIVSTLTTTEFVLFTTFRVFFVPFSWS